MNNLLTELLEGAAPAPSPRPSPRPYRPAPASATPVAPRPAVPIRPLPRESRVRPEVRVPTNRRLRAALRESVENGDSVTLTLSEARSVLRLFEELEEDPFRPASSSDRPFTTSDFEGLGVNLDQNGPKGSSAERAGADDPDALLSPSLAVMAPEATPTEDEVPGEIADELKVFSSPEDDQAPTDPAADLGLPPSGLDIDDATMNRILRGNGDDDDGATDDGIAKIAPTRRTESRQAPAAKPSGGADLPWLNKLREAQAQMRK